MRDHDWIRLRINYALLDIGNSRKPPRGMIGWNLKLICSRYDEASRFHCKHDNHGRRDSNQINLKTRSRVNLLISDKELEHNLDLLTVIHSIQ